MLLSAVVGRSWPLCGPHLRTVSGLGPPQQSPRTLPDDSTRPHTRRSLSDCAGRRKGAARPYGIGLRPTLPPAGAAGGERVMGSGRSGGQNPRAAATRRRAHEARYPPASRTFLRSGICWRPRSQWTRRSNSRATVWRLGISGVIGMNSKGRRGTRSNTAQHSQPLFSREA